MLLERFGKRITVSRWRNGHIVTGERVTAGRTSRELELKKDRKKSLRSTRIILRREAILY